VQVNQCSGASLPSPAGVSLCAFRGQSRFSLALGTRARHWLGADRVVQLPVAGASWWFLIATRVSVQDQLVSRRHRREDGPEAGAARQMS
jgi:hypothetical protein